MAYTKRKVSSTMNNSNTHLTFHLTSLTLSLWMLFAPPTLAALTDGLVVYYPFDGHANDESGHNNHGAEHGGVTRCSS